MNIAEKLESLDCRKDDKARRVLNVAPDTTANITAETLEAGTTLEAIEAINVPVFRYGGQITIHGKLPEFNPATRPGGYKAVFQNQNGSIGVRYCAIDTDKKKLIARACRVKGEFSASATSQGFEVSRCFYVKDESERSAQKLATLAALKALPIGRFFGSAYAFALAYGMGYGIAANIGAIPASELWPLITELTGILDEAELTTLEAEAERAMEVSRAKTHAEYEAMIAKEKSEFAALWETLKATVAPLSSVPVNGEILIKQPDNFLRVTLSQERGRNYYKITADKNGQRYGNTRKVAKTFPWPKSLVSGNIYKTL